MSAMRRCTSCGTYYDGRRFPRCCICGKEGAPAPAAGGADPEVPLGETYRIDDASLGAEAEAARDGKAAGWIIALGVVLGLAGPIVLSNAAGPTASAPMYLGFFIMLIVLGVYGAGAKAKDDPVRFAIGGVARTALTTIGIAIAAGAVLSAAAVALVFVACLASARGSGS